MWRFGFCVVALLAASALAPRAQAQSLHYSTPEHDYLRHGHEGRGHSGRGHGGHRHARRNSGGMSDREIDPYRLGPAPAAFLYHCDAPAGFYPYVPTCRMPWRVVPSGSRR
jgi:hypothetical protein